MDRRTEKGTLIEKRGGHIYIDKLMSEVMDAKKAVLKELACR